MRVHLNVTMTRESYPRRTDWAKYLKTITVLHKITIGMFGNLCITYFLREKF